MRQFPLHWLLPAACLLLTSCGKKDPNRKPTFPVTGQITVDGAVPDSPIAVECHPVKGMDTKNPTVSQTYTEDKGKFAISTYKTGDGVPEGEYILTFYWGKRNLITNIYGGPDRLNGRYKDPKKSRHKIAVKPGEPTNLGLIDLKTK